MLNFFDWRIFFAFSLDQSFCLKYLGRSFSQLNKKKFMRRQDEVWMFFCESMQLQFILIFEG